MRSEFLFWYPMDLRVSGKDLIQNHLTMCLYNHAAIFPKEQWPSSIYCNGHILVDNEKMAKSKGPGFCGAGAGAWGGHGGVGDAGWGAGEWKWALGFGLSFPSPERALWARGVPLVGEPGEAEGGEPHRTLQGARPTSASLNGICNRQRPPPTASATPSHRLPNRLWGRL